MTRGVTEAVTRLRVLRAMLRRRGNGHDVMVVDRCIRLVTMDVKAKNESESAPVDDVGTNVGKKPVTARKPA